MSGPELRIPRLRELWRTEVLLPCSWALAPNQAGALQGASNGFFVYRPEDPTFRAYMKPGVRFPDPRMQTAAREKIAADLAHDLNIEVPPAILANRGGQLPADAEPNTCVTLVLTPKQTSWGYADPIKGYQGPQKDGRVRLAVPKAAARALAFDTWVDQLDHGEDKPEDRHNIIVGTESDESTRLIFLDYSFSFGIGGAWDGGAFNAVRDPHFPKYMLKHLDQEELFLAIDEIERFSEQTIGEVVSRIPASHLPPAEATTIAEGLCARRTLIRPALERRVKTLKA